MIEQSIRYQCDGCGREEYSDCGNPLDWVDDKVVCRKCSKLKPMNQYNDYLALRDKFANDLRFIFPHSKIDVSIEVDEVTKKDFHQFVADAPETGKLSTRTTLGVLEYEVFELENGDVINTAI